MLTFTGYEHSFMTKANQIPFRLLSEKWNLGKIFQKKRIYITIADLVKPMFERNRAVQAFSSQMEIYCCILLSHCFYVRATTVRNNNNNKNFAFSHPAKDANPCLS
jgi:hypothetical protein